MSKIKYAVSQPCKKASDSAANVDLETPLILHEFRATSHELLFLSDKKTMLSLKATIL